MKYYMGDTFNKEENKEYKTLEGGLKAAQKAKKNLYDENGKIVYNAEEAAATPEAPAQQAQEGQEAAKTENSASEAEKEQEGAKTEATAASEEEAAVASEEPAATMTDEVPEGAMEENEDGSVNVYNEDGEVVGTMSKEEAEDAMAAVTDIIDGVPAVRITGRIRRKVDASIRIRNYPSMDARAVRGVSRFEEKKVTHILDVDGVQMYRMSDGYFITANPNIVEYIPE